MLTVTVYEYFQQLFHIFKCMYIWIISFHLLQQMVLSKVLREEFLMLAYMYEWQTSRSEENCRRRSNPHTLADIVVLDQNLKQCWFVMPFSYSRCCLDSTQLRKLVYELGEKQKKSVTDLGIILLARCGKRISGLTSW